MKKMRVKWNRKNHSIEDRNGVMYWGAGMDIDDLLSTIDMLLEQYGLELYEGDLGSNDYLVAIELRKKKTKRKKISRLDIYKL